MYKKYLWIVALAFSLVLGPTAFADSANSWHGMRQMLESLKLDDNQKAKIRPVLEQLKSSMKENAIQMHNLDTQINQQVQSATMDQGVVNGLVDKKTALIGNMIKAKITAKNQIFNILNPQQKAALQNMMKAVEEKIAAKFKNLHDED